MNALLAHWHNLGRIAYTYHGDLHLAFLTRATGNITDQRLVKWCKYAFSAGWEKAEQIFKPGKGFVPMTDKEAPE